MMVPLASDPRFETEEILVSEHTFKTKDLASLDEYLRSVKATGTLHVHFNQGGKTKIGFTQKQPVDVQVNGDK
jgi:hypothetical protein